MSLGRRYWTLWSSFTASNLGDGLTLIGLPLLAVSLTDDARLVTLVAAFRVVPFLTVGLPAGVIIDRFDRRRLAVLAQLVRAAALVVVGLAELSDQSSIALLSVAAFVVGVGEVLIDGGLPAIVRDVVNVDQLEDANSRLRASETVSNNFIGPPLGALLFELDAAFPLLGAAALYLISVAILGQLTGAFIAEQDDDRGAFVEQMKQGLRYVWNHPVLRPLALAVAAFAFVGEAGNATLVILATERLGLSPFQYGLLITVDAVASVFMAFQVTRIVRRTSHGFSMRIAVVTYSIQAILLGTVTFIPLIVFAILMGGVSDPTWNVVSATVRQRLVDDRIFGRMMTAYLFIAWSMQPVGAVMGGVVAEAFGPQWVFVIAGAVVGSLLVLARPMFRRIDDAMRPSG